MSTRFCYVFGPCLITAASALAAPPTTQEGDPILGFAAPAPATQPVAATRPAVFKPADDDGETRTGTLTLSDGTTVHGRVSTTAEKPVRIWVEAEKKYEDVPLSMITSVKATVVWERVEQEWNFKESGSDIKVYSGRTYPARQTSYAVALTDGTVITGDVVSPLYLSGEDGKSKTYVLHKRDKGPIGQTLKQLVYVTDVKLTP